MFEMMRFMVLLMCWGLVIDTLLMCLDLVIDTLLMCLDLVIFACIVPSILWNVKTPQRHSQDRTEDLINPLTNTTYPIYTNKALKG